MNFYIIGIISGCLWGALGYALGYAHTAGNSIWGGVVASPFIGLLMCYFSKWFNRFGLIGRLSVSLLSLCVAAALYGLGIGFADLFWVEAPNRIPYAVVTQSVLACLWMIAFGGAFIYLWPLAYFNHKLLTKFL